MCAESCGATFTRSTTASATACACWGRRRPAPNSCRRAIVMPSIRGRRHIAVSTCMMMAASTPRSAGWSLWPCATPQRADRMRKLLALALIFWASALPSRADTALHSLWELHGKHNTVYLLGSIHVLRPSDYPLAPVVLQAYRDAKSVLMEVNLEEISSEQVQAEMLGSAVLPEGKTLPDVLGRERYGRADALAHEVGLELSLFDQFAPWFAAEAISQQQLMQLGFQPESGVEMYFMERARNDGKSVAG